jgi:serine/threonine protein kinase
MTTVGTPLYMAPEILKNDRYDSKADVYSFGICLIAMMRAEKNVVEFFFESLRKSMKRKHLRGIGINILNNRVVNQGWRPLIPKPFRLSYPELTKLLKECWQGDPKLRPHFDDIVRRISGEIQDEVRHNVEPEIVLLSLQADEVYWDDKANGGGEQKGDIDESKEESEDGDGVKDWKALFTAAILENDVLKKRLEASSSSSSSGEGGGSVRVGQLAAVKEGEAKGGDVVDDGTT